MAYSAAVLVKPSSVSTTMTRQALGQISPNRLCHVCGPLAEMAPASFATPGRQLLKYLLRQPAAGLQRTTGQREAGTAMTATPRKDFSTLIHKG